MLYLHWLNTSSAFDREFKWDAHNNLPAYIHHTFILLTQEWLFSLPSVSSQLSIFHLWCTISALQNHFCFILSEPDSKSIRTSNSFCWLYEIILFSFQNPQLVTLVLFSSSTLPAFLYPFPESLILGTMSVSGENISLRNNCHNGCVEFNELSMPFKNFTHSQN